MHLRFGGLIFGGGGGAYFRNFTLVCTLNAGVFFGHSDISIPEDIDEQLSLSSFHSGSAKVCCFLIHREVREPQWAKG